jgi:hypothetical protein
MISFEQFFTEGKYELSGFERSQIHMLAEKYISAFKEKPPTKDVILGVIKFVDLATNKQKTAKVIVSPKQSNVSGLYNEKAQTITLFFSNTGLYNVETIVNMISHEVYHAKQQYKKEDKYEPYSLEKEKEHYTHPTEYPVYVTNFLDAVERYYVNICNKLDEASDERSARVWKIAKDRFMKFLETFLKTGATEIVNTPSFFSSHERFIDFIVRHKDDNEVRRKYQKFFKDVALIYAQLKDYESR